MLSTKTFKLPITVRSPNIWKKVISLYNFTYKMHLIFKFARENIPYALLNDFSISKPGKFKACVKVPDSIHLPYVRNYIDTMCYPFENLVSSPTHSRTEPFTSRKNKGRVQLCPQTNSIRSYMQFKQPTIPSWYEWQPSSNLTIAP